MESKFIPGEVVELKGVEFRVAATNHEGKLILTPVHIKESMTEMMMRLQSTRPVKLTDVTKPATNPE